ncbi:hypothetical protein [Saccharothrix sp.]|nr:hypothetical protein [Saccharothrix sp.]
MGGLAAAGRYRMSRRRLAEATGVTGVTTEAEAVLARCAEYVQDAS